MTKMRRTLFRGAAFIATILVTLHPVFAEDVPPGLLDYEMILVPGGRFLMGSATDDRATPRNVLIRDYQLAATEVTVGDFELFAQDQEIPFEWNSFSFTQWIGRSRDMELPLGYSMYFVTWYEAVWFANWLSDLHDLTPAYSIDIDYVRHYLYGPNDPENAPPTVTWIRDADGYRLPTEAEWEFAATERGGLMDLSESEILQVAWLRENSEGRVHPPRQKDPTLLGHYDLLGNVSEWVWDYYRPFYGGGSLSADPVGPDQGESPHFPDRHDVRVFRGCSWRFPTDLCDPHFRGHSLAAQRGPIGFRVARNAQ